MCSDLFDGNSKTSTKYKKLHYILHYGQMYLHDKLILGFAAVWRRNDFDRKNFGSCAKWKREDPQSARRHRQGIMTLIALLIMNFLVNETEFKNFFLEKQKWLKKSKCSYDVTEK